jgi:hypothetical protein
VVASFAGSADYTGGTALATFAIARATPAFSALGSPTITDGAATAVLSGKISLGALVPTGSVSITVNGVSRSAAVAGDGSFAVAFPTGALAGGSYRIDYGYAGDTNFNGAAGSGTLTVAYGTRLLFDNSRPVVSYGPLRVMLQVTDAAGANASSPTLRVTAVDIVGPTGKPMPATNGGIYQATLFTYDPSLRGYTFNLSIRGLPSGSYTFEFTVGNDPTLHSLTFRVL